MNPVAPIVANAAPKLLIAALRRDFPNPQLSECVTINNGQGLRAEERDGGECDVYGSGGLVGTHSGSMHPGPFVVIGRKGSAGKITFAPRGGWVTDTAYFATPLSRDLDCKFLFYALRSLDFSGGIITTAIPGINRTAIYSYTIPLPSLDLQTKLAEFLDAVTAGKSGSDLPELPPPISEQRRVVARIEELAAQIHEARSLRQQADKEADGLVRSARNDFVNRAKNQHPEIQLSEICTKITDGPHVSPKYTDEGVPFISVRNISETSLDFSTAKYVTPADHAEYSRKARVERGDVLYTKGGTTGVARRVDTDREFSIWVHVALLKLDRSRADAGFVEHMLNAPSSKEQAEFFTRGSSNRDLGLSRMAKIHFPLPPLAEQRRVVAELDALQVEVDALKRLQAETATELDALLPSILDRAFNGSL